MENRVDAVHDRGDESEVKASEHPGGDVHRDTGEELRARPLRNGNALGQRPERTGTARDGFSRCDYDDHAENEEHGQESEDYGTRRCRELHGDPGDESAETETGSGRHAAG